MPSETPVSYPIAPGITKIVDYYDIAEKISMALLYAGIVLGLALFFRGIIQLRSAQKKESDLRKVLKKSARIKVISGLIITVLVILIFYSLLNSVIPGLTRNP